MKQLYILFFSILSLNLLGFQNYEINESEINLQIVIRFKDDYKIRIKNGKLVSLSDCKLESKFLKLIDVQNLRRSNIDFSESHFDSLQITTERFFNRKVGNMNSSFIYQCKDSNELNSLLIEFKKINYIESFYKEVKGSVPSPPSTQYTQTYLSNGSNGINADIFWSTFSNRGTGVKIVDIEKGINQNHQDLNATTFISNSGVTSTNDDHGTSVAGIINSKNNGWGTTGISSDCQYYFCPANTTTSIASAITAASNAINAGDVILIELSVNGPNPNDANCPAGYAQCGYLPVEYFYNCYLAIQGAVANGRIVVEAAGNGYQNLDASINSPGNGASPPHYPFLSANNSGAVMVGAGGSGGQWNGSWYTVRSRLPYSNYGSRLDLQGVGDNVLTTGYGTYYNTEGTNYFYTSNFDGTSSASPMVVGAIALIQSKYRQSNGGASLSKSQILSALKATAKPQQSGTNPTSQNIGGLPDVVAAYNLIVNNNNDNCSQATQLTSNTSCSYQNFSVSGATESSGFSIPTCSGTPSVYAYDVWFKFTAQASSHTITVDPEGTYSGSSNNSYVDPIIAVYSACSNGSLIQCEDDAGGGGGNCNITLNGLTVGTTYYIRVYDYSGGSTVPPTYPVFGICVTHTASTTCPNPTGTNEASIQTDNIRYDWDDMSGATNGYSVRYRSGSGSWITFPSPNSFLTVSGYTCNTNYEWEVRTECASSSSDWSSTRSATTSPCPNSCGVPQNMQTTNITATSANLNIGNSSVFGAVGYEFRYRVVGSTSWTTLYTTATAKDISGLTCNTNYEWQMRTDCGNGLYSSFTNIITFTTQNCATQSIDLTKLSDNITFNPTNLSITHSLVNNGTANSGSFGVTYVLSKSSTFSTIDYTLGTENVNGLNASSNTQINKSFDLCSANIENGSYYFGYYIDKNNVIAESNENNNFWSLNTSTLIDCRIDLVSTNSRFDLLNDVLTFDMGIQNTGNIDVQNAKVSFYLSRLSNFSSLDVHLGDEILPQVSGNSDPVRFKKPFNLCNLNVPTGDYYIGFVIDKDNTIKEIDEKNTYSAKDAVYYECGTSSIQIAGNFNSEISIYPNPTTGDIFISNILKDKLVEIYSIEGKKVKETLTKDRFNISDLDNGTFIIKIDGKTFKVSLNK